MLSNLMLTLQPQPKPSVLKPQEEPFQITGTVLVHWS